jgi:hypothetical protein
MNLRGGQKGKQTEIIIKINKIPGIKSKDTDTLIRKMEDETKKADSHEKAKDMKLESKGQRIV